MKENLKVSLIVAVYKDIEALDLIVQNLKRQTYKNFELVVAEDNNADEMKEYITAIEGLEVKHTFQEDRGIRKTRSINNAILASEGDYLIFIDGDCIPYSTFIESHVRFSQQGYILSGRRCNLGPRYSAMLRQHKISPYQLEKSFIWRYPFIAYDAIEKHAEAGVYLNPDKFFYRAFFKKRKRTTSLLGCNYSCFKKDMLAINGYDEGYGESSVGDDTDLQWRFQQLGLKIKSVKNVANMFHLYHSRSFRDFSLNDIEYKKMLINKSEGNYKCAQGLDKH